MNVASRLLRVAVFGSVLLPAAARASDWSITTADFRTEPVTLRGLSADGVRVAGLDGAGARVVPLEQFISAQRPADPSVAPPAPPPRFTLALAGGDRLVGEPAAVENERLTWVEPLLGRVPVPFSRLAGMTAGVTVAAPADDRPAQDLVTLSNGDTVTGVVNGVGHGKLLVRQGDGTAGVPLASVVRVAFASAGGGPTPPPHAFRVRLSDGSAVTVARVSVEGDGVSVTLPGKGARPVPLHLADVLSIEQLDGPVGWLSSRTPTESVQVPYLGGATAWPARFDAAVDGGPLAFNGKPFDRGIGVHAYSRLTFAVEPGWSAFRTQYAIDSRRDAPRLLADVVVRVKVDGKVVHEQAGVRAGALSPVVRVDLTGAKSITLECDYGASGDTQAHLDWFQPGLLRAGAATRP